MKRRGICNVCRGTRRVQYRAREYIGGKVVREWTYDAECPRCLGIELWVSSHRGAQA